MKTTASNSAVAPFVRLSDKELKAIKAAIALVDSNAKIILFGSRVDPDKKGGDIDLLIISNKINYALKRKIRVELFKKLGDRKIDIIVVDDPFKDSFTKAAFVNGVEL